MNDKMSNDFTKIEKMLAKADIDFSASFMHGVLTALAMETQQTNNQSKTDNELIISLINDKDKHNVSQIEAVTSIKSLKDDIFIELTSEDLIFTPLLDKNSCLTDEIISTKDWASGFMLAIDKIGLAQDIEDEDVIEFIDDLSDIAKLSETDDSATADDLMQVQEYLRIGVLSMFYSVSNNS